MSKFTLELIIRSNNKPNIFEINATKELKNCPFCGGKKVYFDEDKFDEELTFYRLICNTCNTHGPIRDSRMNAIKIWNERKENN